MNIANVVLRLFVGFVVVTLFGASMRRIEQRRRATFLRKRSLESLQGVRQEQRKILNQVNAYLSQVMEEGIIVVSVDTLAIKLATKQVVKWLFKGQSSIASLTEEQRENLLSKVLKAFTS